jgi:hypothetical protein
MGLYDRYIKQMEACTQCGKPTSLYYQGRAVCIDCDRERKGADESVSLRKSDMSERALKVPEGFTKTKET